MNYLLTISASAGDRFSGYTFFSLPLPRGKFHGVVEGVVEEFSKEVTELWPLAHWPDGSLRIVQGLIPRYAPQVNIKVRAAAESAEFLPEIKAEESFDFGNHRLNWCKHSKMYQMSFSDLIYFDPKNFSHTFTVGEGELVECIIAEPARIVRQQKGWLRISALMKGAAKDGKQALHFRVNWDIFDRIAGCVMSVMLIHDCPKATRITLNAVESTLAYSDKGGEYKHGVFQKGYGYELLESRHVETAESLDLRVAGEIFAPKIHNFEVLKDENEYFPHLSILADNVSPISWLGNGRQRVLIEIEDMPLLRPKGVLLHKGRASIGFWPKWAGPTEWPQGRRREIRIALGVEDVQEETDIGRFQARTAALLDTQRAQLAPEVYRSVGFFDMPWLPPCRPDIHPRVEGWASRIGLFPMHPDFINWGDTPDSHYTRTYLPSGKAPRKKGATEVSPELFNIAGRHPTAAGSINSREHVFVNNEYDVLHCLAGGYLRTGNRIYFNQLKWCSCHTMELE
ncbi:MAG: hypothetical protein ACK5NG_01520 [Chthoniobacterales bacterium]